MPGWHEASGLAKAAGFIAGFIAGFWLVYPALAWAALFLMGVP
jgi:hypothetical protein